MDQQSQDVRSYPHGHRRQGSARTTTSDNEDECLAAELDKISNTSLESSSHTPSQSPSPSSSLLPASIGVSTLATRQLSPTVIWPSQQQQENVNMEITPEAGVYYSVGLYMNCSHYHVDAGDMSQPPESAGRRMAFLRRHHNAPSSRVTRSTTQDELPTINERGKRQVKMTEKAR